MALSRETLGRLQEGAKELPKDKVLNHIIHIGHFNCQIGYLNVPLEEAITRYCASQQITREQFDLELKKEWRTDAGHNDPLIVAGFYLNDEFGLSGYGIHPRQEPEGDHNDGHGGHNWDSHM